MKKSSVPLLVFLLIFGGILWVMFDTHILKDDGYGNLLTGESTYGDLPFHLSMISQMSFGGTFPPENPIFAGHALRYPYLINALSAVMVSVGVSLRNSIILPGMFLSLVTAIALFFFSYSIFRNAATSLLTIFLFWFNGGLGFIFFVRDVILKGELQNFIKYPGIFSDYSHLFTEDIHWNNFLSRIVVPERSVLLGIPLGIIILYLLFVKKKYHAVAAVLTGFLLLSHTHTFMIFSLLIPIFALFDFKKGEFKNWIIRWTGFGFITFLISAPQILSILDQVGGQEGFMKFKFGWMADPGTVNFLYFWFKNAGILIPLMVISLFVKSIPLLVKRFTLFGLFVFVLINIIQFQPFDWDNVKFLFWTGIFGAMSASAVIHFIWRKWNVVGKFVAVLLVLGLSMSSFISLYREVKLSHTLFTKEEVELGDWVRKSTDKNAVFLTAPIHNSFVSNFGGRRIFMGYPGLLWVHGIDYSKQESDTKKIYQGTGDAGGLILANKLDYVVIGPRELYDLNANHEFFISEYCLAKESLNYKIYKTNCL